MATQASKSALMESDMKKAIFIDKDGTLIEDIPYNVDPTLLRFMDGALEALKTFRRLRFSIFVVSNQSGIARGYFDQEDLHHLRVSLDKMLKARGVQVEEFFFCPHHPEGQVAPYNVECNCRKPQPGMILRAAEEFNIDLTHSWMIGDILHDVEAGNRAGCKTVLLNNGHETVWEISEYRQPTAMVSSFEEAVRVIAHQCELA